MVGELKDCGLQAFSIAVDDLTLYRLPSHEYYKVEAHEPTWVKNLFLKEASWADNWSVIARCKIAFAFDSRAEVMELPSVNKVATPRYLY